MPSSTNQFWRHGLKLKRTNFLNRQVLAFLDANERAVMEKDPEDRLFQEKTQYDKCMVEMKRWFDFGKFNQFKRRTRCLGVNGVFTPFQEKKNALRVAFGLEDRAHTFNNRGYCHDTYLNINRFQKIYPEYANVRVRKVVPEEKLWTSILGDWGYPERVSFQMKRGLEKPTPAIYWAEARRVLSRNDKKTYLINLVSNLTGKDIPRKKYTIKQLEKMLMSV